MAVPTEFKGMTPLDVCEHELQSVTQDGLREVLIYAAESAIPLIIKDHQRKTIEAAVTSLNESEFNPESIHLPRLERESPAEYIDRLREEVLRKTPRQLLLITDRDLGTVMANNLKFLLERRRILGVDTQTELFGATNEKIAQVCKKANPKIEPRSGDIYSIVIDGENAAHKAYRDEH